ISITALPPDRSIKGKEQIVYTNNSPDTLKNIVFRVILNVHRAGAPRIYGADSDYLTSGIHVDAFTENGTVRTWRYQKTPASTQVFRLQKPLLPHDSVQFA